MRARQHGISLIELLVVVAIISVLFGAATIAIDAAGGARTLEREGKRFAALVSLACERAQLTGRDYGIHVSADGYAFSTALVDGWRLEEEGDLGPRELASGVSIELTREGTAAELAGELPDEPQAACFASGELTPFVAAVRAGELAPFEIEGSIDGSIESRAAEPGG